MGQRGVTGTQNAMRRDINAQLGLHRCLHIDLGQDAKAFAFERGRHPLKRNRKISPAQAGMQTIPFGRWVVVANRWWGNRGDLVHDALP